MVEASITSSRVSGGRIAASRRASMVLPPPGGPTSSTLCAPAAAISSARLAWAWPLTSEKSRSSAAAVGGRGTAGATNTGSPPFSRPTASRKVGAASTRRPSTACASPWFARGTTRVSMPWRRHARPTASAPRTLWIWPSSASSPTTANRPICPFLTAPVAARMPSAMGRSNEVPSFRTSAGARFTVIRSDGNANPALRMAVRTRSRLSRTAESGSPTVVKAGKPWSHVDFHADQRGLDTHERCGKDPRDHETIVRPTRATRQCHGSGTPEFYSDIGRLRSPRG